MSKEISSKIIGQLRQSDRFEDWWTSSPIAIPFLDNEKFPITFMDFQPDHDATFIHEADKALKYFLELDLNYKKEISSYVYKNYQDFVGVANDSGFPVVQINNRDDIWQNIDITEIYVTRRPYNDKDIYIVLSGGCTWEEEHGIQLVFRQGKKLTRVSDNDGHLTEADAYGKPDNEDELLSQF